MGFDSVYEHRTIDGYQATVPWGCWTTLPGSRIQQNIMHNLKKNKVRETSPLSCLRLRAMTPQKHVREFMGKTSGTKKIHAQLRFDTRKIT